MNIESQELHLDRSASVQKLIQQISNENKLKLEEILSKRVQIESASILNLYQLVTQEWQKKQKTIEQLCTLFVSQTTCQQHVANKMVELIQEIDKRNHEDQQRKKAQQERVEVAQIQNQKFKETILQKQKTILEMSEEIEELKSFCEGLEAKLDNTQSKLFSQKQQVATECMACEEYEALLQLLKKEHAQEMDHFRAQKQQEIIQLKKEQRSLQRKIQELLDQIKLNKVELQLAEMAVKEALSLKDASFSNRSEDLDKSDEIYATKSHGQFLNGELECFSNIQEPNHQPIHNESHKIQSSINFIPSSNEKHPEQSFQLKLSSNEDETTLPNPFRKKNGRQVRRYNTQVLNNDLSDSFQSDANNKQTMIKIEKEKKTVALQCNLLKNVPKIIMFSRKKSMKMQQEQSKSMLNSQVQTEKKKKENYQMKKPQRSMTKSMICLSNNPETIGQTSLSKLFMFLSSKIITNRIKTK